MIARVKKLIHKIMPMEFTFTRVYHTHRFGGKISASGPGSDLTQTEAIRQALPVLIKELGVQTVLDAPCGDFYWMRDTHLNIEKYTGIDIVAAIIKKNQRLYGAGGVEFKRMNLVKGRLPHAELILCRDCLVHFSFKDVFAALENFKRSGAKYLLTTTFIRHDNEDIITGGWQPLNLQKPPFNFPQPIRIINEGCSEEADKYKDKCLGLWMIRDIIV